VRHKPVVTHPPCILPLADIRFQCIDYIDSSVSYGDLCLDMAEIVIAVGQEGRADGRRLCAAKSQLRIATFGDEAVRSNPQIL
jgi:hypothetical protein